MAHRLRVRQAERTRRHTLARMDGLDASAVHLGHVRRVDECQGDDPVGQERPVGDHCDVQSRDAKAPHVSNEDQRRPTEEVRVADGEGPQRKRRPAGQTADQREDEREDEHEHLRDHHQLDVRLEAVPDLRHGPAEAERVEERVQELPHLGLRREPLAHYFRIFTRVNGSHFFCSRLIVPFAFSALIALSRSGLNLLPLSMTAP